ncbi:MAG: purine-binding chemotaxis protein CheW [Firmicutes bacterium]|nr:purine-binding chemotaxis protein CheW [Bacillota bacterium]
MVQTGVTNYTEQEEDTLKGKYLIFSMGNERYGLEIRHVTEIIGIQPLTAVPGMPNYIKGITNLRGKIIPVMDARLRFKKAAREYDDRTCIIVLNSDAISIGLIVDSVSEVLAIDDKDIVPPPAIGKGDHQYIKGIGKAGESVKLLLDCRKLLTYSEISSIETGA